MTEPLAPLLVLIVDDDPDDVHLLSEALGRLETPPLIQVASNGEACLQTLKRIRPDLVLLDLKMPGLSGFEVLDAVRKDLRLVDLPIIVLSGSERDADRTEAYQRGANAYLIKPTGLESLHALAQDLDRFWFRRALGQGEPKAP